MIELPSSDSRWSDRSRKAFSAAVVVVCYLIVFAGLLYSFSGGAR